MSDTKSSTDDFRVPIGESKTKPFTIGVIKLDSNLKQRIIGDVEHFESYPDSARFVMERVKGFTWQKNLVGAWDEDLEREISSLAAAERGIPRTGVSHATEHEMAIALRKLEARGADAILGSSGYMFRYNEIVANMTKLPVILSALNLLPVV